MMMRALLFSSLLLPTVLFAQRSEGPSPLRGDTAVRTPRIERRVLESIVFEAEPRSFQIVRVPIPELVRGATSATYVIEPSAAFTVIGQRRGVVTGEADLLVTVRIPADARAGSHMAAHAIFRIGNTEVDVPIETRVRPIYRIKLNVEQTVEGVRAGERLELRAGVVNLGNTTDTVHVSFELPLQWSAPVRDTIIVVGQGEVGHKLLRVTVPKTSATGSFFIRTTAVSRGSSSSTTTTVSVGGTSAYVAPPGPNARFALGAVGTEGSGSAAIAQIAVSGPLTNAIHIDTRIATQPTTNSGGIRGLARVGAYVTEPHFAAWTSTWRTNLGSTVANFGDVMGVNAGGRGASFELDDQTNLVRVTAARAVNSAPDGSRGSILGADYARRFGTTTLGAGLTRLRATSFGEQSLTAAGVRALASPSKDLSLEGALAYRDFIGGSGLGWVAGVKGNLFNTRAQLRISHAPGGSDAFARAETELVASAVMRVNDRTEIVTGYFQTDDTDATANAVKSRVASITPSYRYSDRIVGRAEIRTTSFEVEGNPFSFSNGELHFGIGATVAYKGINYASEAGIDRLTRGVQTPDLNVEDSGARFVWRTTATRPFRGGSLQGDAAYERNARSTGFVPEQMSLTLRGQRVQLADLLPNLTFDAEAGISRWSGIRSFASFRAGVNYLMRGAIEVGASIERNPLMYSLGSRTPMVFAVRIEKSVGLPRMNVGRAAGVVFQDYNGNGRRDADEPGMPNIRVRRGDVHATTDGEGRYRFWEEGRGATVIDATTLPYGWIVHERVEDGNIALTPTTRVEVQIQLGAAERLRNIDVSQLVITAKDDSGRVWVARRTARETAIFEALPVGFYELGLDAGALPEPLRIEGAPPRVNVTRETVTRVRLPVAGRPLRFKSQ